MPKTKAKLQAVAAQAGVSIKTVSRVINNEKYVREETRDKVTKAIKALNYRPTRAARQLRSSKSYNIAIIYEPPGTEFLNGVMEGVFPVCNDADYHVLLEPIPKLDKQVYIDRLISNSNLDGVILLPPESENRELIKSLQANGVKCVVIESFVENVNSIGIDNENAGFLMTQHLLDLGHKRFGYITLSHDRISGNRRLLGLKAALKKAAVPDEDLLVADGDCSLESGYAAAKTLLSEKNPPTAIFAGNDHMAIGAISCARDMDIKVPRDLSVCGFDNTEISRIFSPQLTTITQPLNQYGKFAAQLLLRSINNADEDVKHEVLPFELFKRSSTAKPLRSRDYIHTATH